MPNGEIIEREYVVNAKDEKHAQERAYILARIDYKNQIPEDKYFALTHKGKWYNPFRFRLYRRGFSKLFLNADHQTGSLLKIVVKNLKRYTDLETVEMTQSWDKCIVLNYRKNCILSLGWYGALVLVGIFYAHRGIVNDHYIFFTFLKPALIAGVILTFVSAIYLYRSWKHLGTLTKMLEKLEQDTP